MEIFISWSGDRGGLIAVALERWLRDVLQVVQPWLSQEMQKGVRWGSELSQRLGTSSFGIVRVTPESQHAPWLLFEAGVLSKLPEARVCTYLVGLQTVTGPLSQFQGTAATETDTLRLVRTINANLDAQRLDEARLTKQFNKCWPELARDLEGIPPTPPGAPSPPSTEQLIQQLVEDSRAHSDMLSRIEEALRPMDTAQRISLRSMSDPAVVAFRAQQRNRRYYGEPVSPVPVPKAD